MDIFDLIKYQTVDVQCPKCGKTQVKTLGWLKENQHINCACGVAFAVNLQAYAEQVKMLEQRFQAYLG